MERYIWFSYFFNIVTVQVMPWILSYSTCAVLWVVGLVVACGNCGFIASRLLSVDFLSYIFWTNEDIIVSIYDTI